MKHFIFIVYVILAIGNLAAQPAYEDRKRDYNWVVGYPELGPNSSDYSNIQMNFDEETLTLIDIGDVKGIDYTFTAMSDTSGQLLFYTNGVWVFNRLHQNMLPADTTLSPGYWADQSIDIGYPIQQDAIALPNPANKNQYYLIHQGFNQYVNYSGGYCGDIMYYTLIDMSLNNGLGGIVTFNQVLANGRFNPGNIQACRHANGRDWWLFYMDCARLHYYSILIDDKGFHAQTPQQFTGRFLSAYGQSKFSPDGTRYAQYYSYAWMDGFLNLYNFDRCAGTLDRVFAQDSFPSEGIGTGLEFSPNSRYMYVSDRNYVYQYDTWMPNIEAARDTIAAYDGYLDQGFWGLDFNGATLAPDGKIYIANATSTHFMHVINHPDSSGVGCGLVQRQLELPVWYYRTSPNFPNFRLGALSGSACDTLDFNVAVTPAPSRDNVAGITALVYPNPSASNLTIAYALPEQGEVTVVNALGQVMYEKVLAKGDDKLWLNVEDWANGVYFVRLSTPNSGVYSKKVFVLH